MNAKYSFAENTLILLIMPKKNTYDNGTILTIRNRIKISLNITAEYISILTSVIF